MQAIGALEIEFDATYTVIFVKPIKSVSDFRPQSRILLMSLYRFPKGCSERDRLGAYVHLEWAPRPDVAQGC